jgi:hypothetical protein
MTITETIHQLPEVKIKAKRSIFWRLKRLCNRFNAYIVGAIVFLVLIIANKIYIHFKK